MSQERNIIITNKAIYNLKKKELKRRIEIQILKGITISSLTEELILHGNDMEYDYHYISSKRKMIIKELAESYLAIKNVELPFVELSEKSLSKFVTQKTDKKKDLNFSRMPNYGLTSIKDYYTPRSSNDQSMLFNKRRDIQNVQIEDFKIIKVLGRGSFGKVTLVEFLKTGEVFAMKSLKKDTLIEEDQIQNTLLEKKILQELEHPFLVNLQFCFQTNNRVFFVLPYMAGGELFQHLRNVKRFNEEKWVLYFYFRAKFYAAQIALAIQHLHNYGIIYRDLKPENILIDTDGYLKLADFGMAKRIKDNEKAMSFCGTPEYLSPEIIKGTGHDKATDWWSFGTIL